jgi:hypothetical protein
MFAIWATSNRLQLLEVKRAHIEIFGREMESAGRMRSTAARRLSTVSGFFKYCHDEGPWTATPLPIRTVPTEFGWLLRASFAGTRAMSSESLATSSSAVQDRGMKRKDPVEAFAIPLLRTILAQQT